VESGTHSQLLNKNGYYSFLVYHQYVHANQANAIETDFKDSKVAEKNDKIELEREKRIIKTTELNIVENKKKEDLLETVRDNLNDEVKEKLLRENERKLELDKYFQSIKKKLLVMIMENKGVVFGAAFSAVCSGATYPAFGFLLAESVDAFSQPIGPKFKKDGEMVAIYFAILAFGSGISLLFQK